MESQAHGYGMPPSDDDDLMPDTPPDPVDGAVYKVRIVESKNMMRSNGEQVLDKRGQPMFAVEFEICEGPCRS